MSNEIFPVLPGLKWNQVKTPVFTTLIQRSVSKRESRAATNFYPLYQWDLSYELLRQGGAFAELQTLLGFYLRRQGALDDFLSDDPTDDSVAGQVIGTGDGGTLAFQLVRYFGGWVDLVTDVKASPAPVIYVNGSAVSPSLYSIGMTASGILTFNSAPANGAAITADFSYYWRVRFIEFSDPSMSGSDSTGDGPSNFMQNLWELKALSLVTAR